MKGMAWRIQWNRSVESHPFPKPTCLHKAAPQELLQGQEDSMKCPLLCKSEGLIGIKCLAPRAPSR